VSTASRLPQFVGRLASKLPVTVDSTVRRLAVLSLIGQTVLVVTGGAVRLTASGLGCPTWPRCTGNSLVNTPEMGIHGFIEFGNRLLTFALAAVAALMLVYLWNLRKERKDLFLLALGLLASIPAQSILGGITVLTQLNPWVVGLHFLVSMALVVFATLLVNRAFGRTGQFRASPLAALPGVLRPAMTAVAVMMRASAASP
jgi:cytochrome c oxidase assembly protein subunit 15